MSLFVVTFKKRGNNLVRQHYVLVFAIKGGSNTHRMSIFAKKGDNLTAV